MINLASIVFSTCMVAYVIMRAVVLDNSLPWFGGRPLRPDRKGAAEPVKPRHPIAPICGIQDTGGHERQLRRVDPGGV
jgi:hypothetical protein